jgi:hypothetical protein
MNNLRELIKQALKERTKDCGCGCHGKCAKAPMLNESLSAKITMTSNMSYHIDNKKPLTENTFRYGSSAFLDLWAEARYLYSRNAIHLLGEDKKIITETNLGEYGIYDGQQVPLDIPMIDENTDEVVAMLNNPNIEDDVKSMLFNAYKTGKLTPKQIADIIQKIKGYSNELKYKDIQEDIKTFGKVYESVNIENSYSVDDIESNNVSNSFIFTDKHGIKRKLQHFKGDSVKLLWLNPSTETWSTEKIPSKYEDEKVMNTFGKILINLILPKHGSFTFKALNAAHYRLFRALIYNSLDTSEYEMNFNDDSMEIEVSKKTLNESEYQGKKVQLNKPKRGGSKKFYVYVRDPKTKKVKKVSFGDTTGLSTKVNNPKARKAFASRQQCDKKKDRTKAGYWSCNIGRYWKSLGGSSNFSGYW